MLTTRQFITGSAVVLCVISFVGVFLTMYTPVTATEADLSVEIRNNQEIASQLEQIAKDIELVQALLTKQTETQSSNSTNLTITINDGTPLVIKNATDTESAERECKRVAYDTTYMWQLVTCEYKGEVLYRDVFIAG